MTKRKTILLSAIGILLAVYIIQLAVASRATVGEIITKDSPDFVSIEHGGNAVSMYKDGDNWLTSINKYPVGEKNADGILNTIEKIKILDVVSHSTSAATLERYGLSSPLAIKATMGEKLLRITNKGRKVK